MNKIIAIFVGVTVFVFVIQLAVLKLPKKRFFRQYNAETCAGLGIREPNITPRTVVIAAALNYKLSTFKTFLLSLRCLAKFNGDVVLFVNENLSEDIARFSDVMKVRREPLPKGSHLGVKGNRYIGYDEVCRDYDWCFATDFRDVYFQVDPFANIQKHSDHNIILSEEDHPMTIGKCPYNKDWIQSCWPGVLDKIKDEHIICSGTIFATPSGMTLVRDMMLAEMAISAHKKGCTSRDQGHLNFLYYSHRFGGRVEVQTRGQGYVNTVGYILPRASIVEYMDKSGFVLNTDKDRSAVVHQFDRFPPIVRAIRHQIESLDKPRV
jgi:hypothetical protein